MNWWDWFNAAPAAPHIEREHNPYDVSTWGTACERGIPYAETGQPVAAGTAGVVRKISTGRKHRGSAADDMQRSEAKP